MAVGGCFCGNIRIEFNGQPITSGLCHCLDCRKLTGSHYSYSFVVNTAELKVTGSPKEVPKISDSGNTVRNYFCPDCGTPLYGWKIKPDGEPNEVTVVRAGIFDDIEMLDQRKPEAELFCGSRLKWMNPIEGAAQFSGMPPFL
ncbi:hypothetical protein N7494_011392 [Penicillium frequentans]|uniref:CENP-V/GFA domain-containing protein n=1 Tax=Penicillium frequentans TaxID=3151616 RepID=A0AAD6CJK7_9EURO|nr:hypothetical protein N7494_011392 [Penicillium glabrum]